MLWKKESSQPDALYVDVFTPNTRHWDSKLNSMFLTNDQSSHPEKSNEIALEKRKEGNAFFSDSATIEAMVLYGDSLRFAKPESEHISLAYANRAACFLKMKMYDECLTDIDYAMAAGYPEHLRPKLKDRKEKCLKEMQESPLHPRSKLSIEPNEKFPYLSNLAKVEQNSEKDEYSVVAKKDIDVGQVIVAEDAHQAYVMHSFGMYCNICAKPFCNLVPCEKCAMAMFCPECQGHFLHEYECGLNFCEESDYNTDVMNLLRGILLALKLFPAIDELMAFVEQMLKRPNELPENMLDDRSIYHAYFNRPFKHNINALDQLAQKIYAIYKTLLRIPHVNGMFKTAKHRRFLMHLIGHHSKIPFKVAGILLNVELPRPSSQPISYTPLMVGYMKHSCYPNVEFNLNDGKCTLYAISPIKKGEQLYVSRVLNLLDSTKKRQKFLLDMIKLKCECLRCRGKTAAPAQRQQLVSDPAYHFIQECYWKKGQSLMDACVTLLQNYSQMNWCEEIEYVRKCFRNLYKVRSVGGRSDFKHPLVRELLLR